MTQTDPQELANRIGAAQRATEDALTTDDTAAALNHAQQQHGNLTEAFAYLRDVVGLELDWGQVAGSGGGSPTQGGGAKDSPPAFDGPEA